MKLRRLLFATDFSAASEQAREVAFALATTFDADLTVLHVLEPPPYPYPLSLVESARSVVGAELDRVTDALRHDGVRAERMLLEGSPAAEIIATAEEHGLDWIVLGTHGRRAITRLLMGSVSERVVRLSRVPVLTVPSPPGDTGGSARG
jgi:nucleotide-binding universal stress UspA family protein